MPDSPHPQLLVYKASAGSGKTFTLAAHYIRQLIEDPAAYRRILAVTFTNKATAEMKERILEQLYGIASDDADSESYMKEIRKHSQKTDEEIRRSAQEALTRIIHDYSRFRIETIDSFFQSVLKNLSRELELGANLTIELNNGEVLEDAVNAMIEKLTRRSPVLAWLLEYIEERISDDKRWNVSGEIKNFGWNIFDESYIEKGHELRKKLADPHFIPQYRKTLQDLREAALKQMADISARFTDILQRNNLVPEDLKGGRNGIGSYFRKLANGNLGNDIRNVTAEKCLADAANWAAATSPNRSLIRSLASSQLIPLLEEAESVRPQNNMLVNSCDLSLRYLNNLRLLADIDNEVRLQNQEHNRFLLSDTNALLHGLIREGDASFIYEKIGTTLDTVMIDEFQDTSRMQWENFHLLLDECLSQKEGSLIVGDVKQSIYRWRNGDWKILANLSEESGFRTKECTLDTNWRSEARIIRFNNEIFQAACYVLNSRYEEERKSVCTQLVNAYSDVKQKTAKKEEKGYVKITFLPDNKENPYTETTLACLAEEVERLISQGLHTEDIAILVRKNKTIPAIADYFEEHTPYRIVSDEAFRLDASLAVNMMMDGLRYLASPDNLISQARLAGTYQREIMRKETDLNTILLRGADNYLPEEFLKQEEGLRFMPLYELLEKLFRLFNLQEIGHQDAYVCAFFDAVTEYIGENSSDLTAFINYWDETLHEKTIPSGEIEGIRILSIHKSKGLEFHTVIIPFCDWKMENETNSHLIWCSVTGSGKATDIPPFNQLDIAPINYSKAMAESVYCESYLEERLQLWVDNLNLLYVAFTRACKNLVVFSKKNQQNTVSGLIYEAISEMESLKMDETGTDGDEEKEDAPETFEYGTTCLERDEEKKKKKNRLSIQPEAIPVRIESLETDIEFKQSNRSADFIRGDEEKNPEEYILRGQLLHRVFASVEKKSDLPKAIENLRFEGVFESAAQEEEIAGLARKALENPQVQEWFDGGWKLYNECSIIFTDDEGNMQTRRPDRVMMKDGRVVVVDFKFGKRNNSHRKQVHEYMELLKAMGYTQQMEGYLWYVTANELEPVD